MRHPVERRICVLTPSRHGHIKTRPGAFAPILAQLVAVGFLAMARSEVRSPSSRLLDSALRRHWPNPRRKRNKRASPSNCRARHFVRSALTMLHGRGRELAVRCDVSAINLRAWSTRCRASSRACFNNPCSSGEACCWATVIVFIS